ncbi:hypothetical protein [endosymbiont 'TC1' of Trimyema compressum]|nr:hypothetical protein [endosymbiont 'TC1' of Trimyema compressum]
MPNNYVILYTQWEEHGYELSVENFSVDIKEVDSLNEATGRMSIE